MSDSRESLGSRLGFILLSAGCAIGLGNVWRFPFVTGKYGGAIFVLFYLFFLVLFGLPVLTAEFAVGRGSRQSIARSFNVLEPKGTKWHIHGYLGMAGNYLLMMFYTVVAGWMLCYFYKTVKGDFVGLNPEEVCQVFGDLLASPGSLITWMSIVIVLGFGICFIGLQNGVERITKVMMCGLLFVMLGLVVYVATLPGAGKGYEYFLKPDVENFQKNGVWETIYAALGQSFFTLSLGIGSMAIFGSYIDKKHRLAGEALRVMGLDTFVAICSGLIVIPACFAFDQNPSEGPGLVLVTLPNIFNKLGDVPGRIIGSLFFIFMSFAALSTVIAVFENIVSFLIDKFGFSRRKSVLINLFAVYILSLPAALGMSVWSDFKILGFSIDGFEDFIVSNNLLPLGSLVYLMFIVSKKGWGWENFIKEADTGKGIKFPKFRGFKQILQFVYPVIFLTIFVFGYIDMISSRMKEQKSNEGQAQSEVMEENSVPAADPSAVDKILTAEESREFIESLSADKLSESLKEAEDSNQE